MSIDTNLGQHKHYGLLPFNDQFGHFDMSQFIPGAINGIITHIGRAKPNLGPKFIVTEILAPYCNHRGVRHCTDRCSASRSEVRFGVASYEGPKPSDFE